MNRASKKKLVHSHTQDCDHVDEESEEQKETPMGLKESNSLRKKAKNKRKTSHTKKKEFDYIRTSHNVKNKQDSILD